MILIPQPALAFNQNTPGARDEENIPERDFYRMTYNYQVMNTHSMAFLREKILHYASIAGGYLQALVINAHGWTRDGAFIGSGLNLETLPGLVGSGELYGKIGTIYFCSCGVAGTPRGEQLCSEMARQLNTTVIASDSDQIIDGWDREDIVGIYPMFMVPANCIDDFEGNVRAWSPDGRCTSFSTPLSPSAGGSVTGRIPG